MKYLVIISQAHADGTDVPAMTAYDDYNKAVSAFHMELAYSAISDAVASDMAMLADTTGRVYEVTVVQGAAKPAAAATDTGTATDATTAANDSATAAGA